jgi:hypothetical protein
MQEFPNASASVCMARVWVFYQHKKLATTRSLPEPWPQMTCHAWTSNIFCQTERTLTPPPHRGQQGSVAASWAGRATHNTQLNLGQSTCPAHSTPRARVGGGASGRPIDAPRKKNEAIKKRVDKSTQPKVVQRGGQVAYGLGDIARCDGHVCYLPGALAVVLHWERDEDEVLQVVGHGCGPHTDRRHTTTKSGTVPFSQN